jgi:hypothetical protein
LGVSEANPICSHLGLHGTCVRSVVDLVAVLRATADKYICAGAGLHGADCDRHFEALVDMLELKRQSLSTDTQDMQMTRSKHMAEGRHG